MKLAVLGATGSVGTQALDVARKIGCKICAISCNSDIKKAELAVREFGAELCAVENERAASELKAALKDTGCRVIAGDGAAARLAVECKADTVLNAITGIAGLMPTVKALECGKRLALANKESLVAAGAYVMALAGENNTEILPVDSEHCAIWQSLRAGKSSEVKRLILTASGGPFFGYARSDLENVTPEQAVKHPTWSMGTRITVDSATLMNKGFEVIEAAWLFGMNADKIDVIVHRESIIHSMVEYIDNTVIAQMGVPDMRTCIQYALTCPERREGMTEPLDLVKVGSLSFYKPDREAFPLLSLAERICGIGGSYGAALNGADEEAVRLFLMGKIALPRLFEAVEEATLVCGCEDTGIDAVFESDRQARAFIHDKYGIN